MKPQHWKAIRWHEGDVLKKYRRHLRWTLEQASTASGVDPNVIHRIETGATKDPRSDTLERLAETYGLSLLDLRSFVPQQKMPCSPSADALARVEALKFHGAVRHVDTAKKRKQQG